VTALATSAPAHASPLPTHLTTCGLPVRSTFNGATIEIGQCVKPVGHPGHCQAARFAMERR
jgi:hypothetical protein